MNSRFLQPTQEIFSQPLPAIVEVSIQRDRPGRVAFGGSSYPARLHEQQTKPLHPGQRCKVLGREGITLLVTATS